MRPLSRKNVMVIADSLPYDGWKSSEITRIMNKQSVYSWVCYYCPSSWVFRVSWDSLNYSTVPRDTKKPRLET